MKIIQKMLKNGLKKVYYTIFSNKSREVPIPPDGLVSIGQGSFVGIGKEFLTYFIEIGHIKPKDIVLDVGCGIGRMAIPLTRYLNSKGLYHGFDVVKTGIEWCQDNISPRYPNFHFAHSDIINKKYNPKGRIKAAEYVFPYGTNTFDFVFLTSVFTHTLQEETEHYLSEIARVIKKGGRVFITYFLINEDSKRLIAENRSSLPFKRMSDLTYAVDLSVPEKAIAYDQEYILNLYQKHQFKVEKICYGKWCERKKFLSYQDIIVAVKN